MTKNTKPYEIPENELDNINGGVITGPGAGGGPHVASPGNGGGLHTKKPNGDFQTFDILTGGDGNDT